MVFSRPVEPLHQDWHDKPRKQERRGQSDRHSQRQRLEEGAGDPGQEGPRQEDQNRGGRRAGQRPKEFLRGQPHRQEGLVTGLRHTALHVLDHHDGVIDDQADCRRHPAKRHNVKTLPRQFQYQGRQGQNCRDDHDRDDGDAEIAQIDQ